MPVVVALSSTLLGASVAGAQQAQTRAARSPTFYTLIVILDNVTGTLSQGEHRYRPGEVVRFEFRPAAGYTNAALALDDARVATRGKVTMNRDHVIFASADRAIVITPELKKLMALNRELLTSRDPWKVTMEIICEESRLGDTLGWDAAELLVAEARFLAYDPVRDGDALLRVNSIMGSQPPSGLPNCSTP